MLQWNKSSTFGTGPWHQLILASSIASAIGLDAAGGHDLEDDRLNAT
jgi:hypothetical protein